MKPGSTTSRKILSNPGFAGFSPLRLPHQGTRRVEGAGPSIIICTSVSIVLSDSHARVIWRFVELAFFRLIACWRLLVVVRFHHERGGRLALSSQSTVSQATRHPSINEAWARKRSHHSVSGPRGCVRKELAGHLTHTPESSNVYCFPSIDCVPVYIEPSEPM